MTTTGHTTSLDWTIITDSDLVAYVDDGRVGYYVHQDEGDYTARRLDCRTFNAAPVDLGTHPTLSAAMAACEEDA